MLNRRVDLHAIDATPARWRGDAGSSPLNGANTAASAPRNDFAKNCAPDSLFDFHTGADDVAEEQEGRVDPGGRVRRRPLGPVRRVGLVNR